jgi:hypothetical protein
MRRVRLAERSRRELRVGLVVAAALALFVVGTYAVVVLGAGTLLGAGDSVVLPVVATAVVALGFEPVQRRAERAARALVAGPVSAYDVLSRFSETVTGGFPTASCRRRWRSCSPRAREPPGRRSGSPHVGARRSLPPGRPAPG